MQRLFTLIHWFNDKHLQTRVREHTADYKKFLSINSSASLTLQEKEDAINKLSCKTACIKHAIDKSHTFNYENTTIIGKENNSSKLETLEMIKVKQQPCVNSRKDRHFLGSNYDRILNKFKQETR